MNKSLVSINTTSLDEIDKNFIMSNITPMIDIIRNTINQYNYPYNEHTIVSLFENDTYLLNELMTNTNNRSYYISIAKSLQYWMNKDLYYSTIYSILTETNNISLLDNISAFYKPQILYLGKKDYYIYHYKYKLSDLYFKEYNNNIVIINQRTKNRFIPIHLLCDPELILAYIACYKVTFDGNRINEELLNSFNRLHSTNNTIDSFEFSGIHFDEIFYSIYNTINLSNTDFIIDMMFASKRLLSRSGNLI